MTTFSFYEVKSKQDILKSLSAFFRMSRIKHNNEEVESSRCRRKTPEQFCAW